MEETLQQQFTTLYNLFIKNSLKTNGKKYDFFKQNNKINLSKNDFVVLIYLSYFEVTPELPILTSYKKRCESIIGNCRVFQININSSLSDLKYIKETISKTNCKGFFIIPSREPELPIDALKDFPVEKDLSGLLHSPLDISSMFALDDTLIGFLSFFSAIFKETFYSYTLALLTSYTRPLPDYDIRFLKIFGSKVNTSVYTFKDPFDIEFIKNFFNYNQIIINNMSAEYNWAFRDMVLTQLKQTSTIIKTPIIILGTPDPNYDVPKELAEIFSELHHYLPNLVYLGAEETNKLQEAVLFSKLISLITN